MHEHFNKIFFRTTLLNFLATFLNIKIVNRAYYYLLIFYKLVPYYYILGSTIPRDSNLVYEIALSATI